MSDPKGQDDPRGVHEGEAGGHVQSPSHHLTRPASSPRVAATGDNLLQDPAGNPAVGAAEDKSGDTPSTRTTPTEPA